MLKCLECNKNYAKKFDKDLIKRFANTYEFCDEDISKFCLMLKKEYINIHILIHGKDLMKHCYQTKNNFTIA